MKHTKPNKPKPDTRLAPNEHVYILMIPPDVFASMSIVDKGGFYDALIMHTQSNTVEGVLAMARWLDEICKGLIETKPVEVRINKPSNKPADKANSDDVPF